MGWNDLLEKGLAFRKTMFGKETVETRMNQFGAFGEPLQQVINGWAYGDIWQRGAIPPRIKSLIVVGMNAAAGHPAELRIHLKGAIATSGTNSVPFTLPANFHPGTNVFVPIDLCDATNGRLFIQHNGVVSVEAEGNNFSNAQCFTSLDGVSFIP